MYKNKQTGFTIIELLIATTVFSIVLTVILASFLQVGRMYYKGISLSSTNESARSLVEAITNDVRLSQAVNVPGPNYFCTGAHRYTFILNRQVTTEDIVDPDRVGTGAGAGVRQDSVSGECPSPDETRPNARQLLGANMQLNRFNFPPCAENGCSLDVHIVYYGFDNRVFTSTAHPGPEDPDAATDPDAVCSGSLLSTQFCATATIITNVSLRH